MNSRWWRSPGWTACARAVASVMGKSWVNGRNSEEDHRPDQRDQQHGRSCARAAHVWRAWTRVQLQRNAVDGGLDGRVSSSTMGANSTTAISTARSTRLTSSRNASGISSRQSSTTGGTPLRRGRRPAGRPANSPGEPQPHQAAAPLSAAPSATVLPLSDEHSGDIAAHLAIAGMGGQQPLPVRFAHGRAMTPELAQVMPGGGVTAQPTPALSRSSRPTSTCAPSSWPWTLRKMCLG